MALEAIQQKKQFIESRARIREFVFGIQDGLISTVGLLAGIQGATENTLVVIIAGLTAMFSGAISMAAGSYLSSLAQKEIFDKELREAEKLAEREPYMAAEGLLRALGEEGLSKEQSYRMVKVLSQERNVFMRTFQEKVFGLGSAEINRPLQAALVMGLSFILGATIPMIPYMISSGLTALYHFGAAWRHHTLRRRRLQRETRRQVGYSLRFGVFPGCSRSGRSGISDRLGGPVLFPGSQYSCRLIAIRNFSGGLLHRSVLS